MTGNLAQPLCRALVAFTLLFMHAHGANGQDTAFTYQGVLRDNGAAVTDLCDLQFTLMTDAVGGSVVAGPVTLLSVSVDDGLFTADLDFGAGAINGSTQWLQIEVRHPVGGGVYTPLFPRQRLAPTPSALFALSSPDSLWQLNGLDLHYDAGNIGIHTNTPTQPLHVNGNVRVDGWIGTDNDAQVWIASNGTRVMSLRYREFDDGQGVAPAPNIVGGSPSNYILSGAVGGTIAGGGFYDGTLATSPNFLADNFCTIGGGMQNQAGDPAGTFNEHAYATVAGGFLNSATDKFSFIGGGQGNIASAWDTVVAGGQGNTASSQGAFVGAGAGNQVTGGSSAIVAGQANVAGGGGCFIGAGDFNTTAGIASVVTGGGNNTASGHYSSILGGRYNTALGLYSQAAGRRAKSNHDGTFVWADSADADFISTDIDQFLVRADGGMGVNTNLPLADLHVRALGVGLDSTEVLNDGIILEADDAVMGLYSSGSGSWGSALAMSEFDGAGNLLDKWTLQRNTVGAGSWLHLTYGGWNYGTNPSMMTVGTNGFVGFGLTPIFPLHMASGAHCTAGGTWTNASSRDLKENVRPVDRFEVLKRVAALPIGQWNYKAENDTNSHIGPMAEDFAAAFDLGDTDKAIATVDADGVALVAIQALNELVQQKDRDIEQLKKRVAELESVDDRLAELESLVHMLTAQASTTK